ncbi:MAG: putative toxin-antitoxin system toxin component, PIN family [Armatimonadota bacterium]|nr:putative toxin-antitoxin system toxin component, PIN family [Armatimonadota bacterium]
MRLLQIVIDTNVLIAALRSKRGASFLLLSLLGASRQFEINLSVPLVLEYEDVAMRPSLVTGFSTQDISDILDYLCLVANRHEIFFLWRPFLVDSKDDMVLELAVEAQCDYIVTFNKRHFAGIERFGLQAVTPQEFLRQIGELS